MTNAEQLRAAKALIDTPDKWTKGCFARRADGLLLMRGESWDEAVCFCSEGAVRKASNGLLPPDVDRLLERAVPRTFHTSSNCRNFVLFNDAEETSHADVMKMFDRAIKLAEAAQ